MKNVSGLFWHTRVLSEVPGMSANRRSGDLKKEAVR